MYFQEDVAKMFAEREQNEKNFRAAAIIDMLAMHATKTMASPLHIADLGGGAHPDRYHKLFERLLREQGSRIDWVDHSPIMLKLAREYVDTPEYRKRLNVIRFIERDFMDYLRSVENDSLDLIIMKYTFDYVDKLNDFFNLVNATLKSNGSFIATMTLVSPELRSVRTNTRSIYRGEEFPVGETRTLEDGETFTLKFFKESNNPESGYMRGAQTEKIFFTEKTIESAAKNVGLSIFIGNWKDIIPSGERREEDIDQNVLIAKKEATVAVDPQ